MNLSYLKYAAEVEKTGSITKAAQNFYMNQPHLSKIIRELEKDLGSPIFDRTSRGMVPTKRGEEFLRYAKAILVQEEQIDALCARNKERSLDISLCAPRSTYIAVALGSFIREMKDASHMNLRFRETNLRDTIRHVASKTFDLGIIRCQSLYEASYLKMLQEENLTWTGLWEFSFGVLMSAANPLAEKEKLTYLDLTGFLEIQEGDMRQPSFSFEEENNSAAGGPNGRFISVYDRGSQFELLKQLPDSYMWSGPIPYESLASTGLIFRPCSCPGNRHKDILIFRSGYKLSKEENLMLCHLQRIISQLSE